MRYLIRNDCFECATSRKNVRGYANPDYQQAQTTLLTPPSLHTTYHAPASALFASALLPPTTVPVCSLAARCHAGIVALRSLRSNGFVDGVELSCFATGAGAEGVPVASVLGVDAPLVLEGGFGRGSFGLSFPFPFGAWVFHAGVEDLPTLFSSSFFKLCISWLSSSNFASPFAFQPSRALGTWSFSPWIWSDSILLSASRRVFAALRSWTMVSTSFSVVSSFCVRCVSFSLRSAVSVVS